MNRSGRVLAATAILLVLLGATGCSKLKARDQLNKGVQAYKAQKYEEAVGHFKQAIAFDESLMNARLYLATAYATQYIPGADSPENNRNAEEAIKIFQDILQRDPKPEQKILGLKRIASLYFNMKKMDKALDYYKQVSDLDPNDPENYYSIAVIDWTETYQPRMKVWAENGLKPDQQLTDKKACAQLRQQNEQKVEDGIVRLQKAIQLRSDYDDAMAYLNLLYRERAYYECEDPAARSRDLDEANAWVDRTIATKKAKAERAGQQAGAVIMENQ